MDMKNKTAITHLLTERENMKVFHKYKVVMIGSIALLISSCASSPQITPTSDVLPIVTLPPAATIAPTSPQPEAGDVSQLPPDLAYGILLEQVKQADPDFDFTELRWTFAQTANYDPYNFDESGLEDSMYDAYDNQDYELAIEIANQLLEKNYLLPDPHFIALQSYDKLGDQKNADFHNYFLRGLITSIAKSGDGRSPETAFIVVQIKEEYFMLNILGLQDSEQTFTEINGIPYDVFNGIDETTNNPTTIYFDISIPYSWINNLVPQ